MDGYKTSFILTKSELLYLLRSLKELPPKIIVDYFIDEYLKISINSEESVEGLVCKKMAKIEMGTLLIEPIIEIIIKSIIKSNKCWRLKIKEYVEEVMIFRTNDLYLVISNYQFATDTLKIEPFQKKIDLVGELVLYPEILKIDLLTYKGIECELELDDNYIWLKED